jgi:hypothetical protein
VVTLVNLHLKRNWGLIKPDVEFSLSAVAGLQDDGLNGGIEAQAELHVDTTMSLVAASSVTDGPHISFSEPTVGIVVHWDIPAK